MSVLISEKSFSKFDPNFEKSFDHVRRFSNQSYWNLRKKCQSSGKLFTDEEFDIKVSIGKVKAFENLQIDLKRPHEICERPTLNISNGSQIKQGLLGYH